METFETLRRRRMCRSFVDRSVSEELIERLLYAANRSPAAGNVRTSNITIVRDPFTIREIKMVSPGFGGLCPLVFAICTDQTASEESDVASFDAGTIAENIALAAVDIGLGVCFLKSFPDAAVRKILKIPEQAKIEMLICVGYPAKESGKTKAIPIRLFEESYGNQPASKTGTETRVPNQKEESISSTPFDLALFVLSSARTTIDESNRYGPKRLFDTLVRLLDLNSNGENAEFFTSIQQEILKRPELRSSSMVYTKEFKDFLDSLLARFVSAMEKQRVNER